MLNLSIFFSYLVLCLMAWLAVVLAAARESFQAKDLGAKLVSSSVRLFMSIHCPCLVGLTFGSKLAHGHFWRQPQSERGVLARIQVQSRLFRTNVLFFCSQRFNAAVRVYIYIIFIYIHICCQGSGWSSGLCQVRGAFASLSRAAVIEARQRCLIFGTVDRRRVPCACFTVRRPLRGLFLFFSGLRDVVLLPSPL